LEQCNKPFARRTGSGGKPQRFCSEGCRRQYHAENLPTPKSGVGENELQAIPEPPASKPPSDAENEWEWDWIRGRDHIVVPSQPAIAVYFNPRGEVVIRQESRAYPDEDHFVYLQVENLDPLIDELQRIARREIVPE
jgi:hypothetical protein